MVNGDAHVLEGKERVGLTGVGLEVSLRSSLCSIFSLHLLVHLHSIHENETFSQLGGKDPAYVRPDADLQYTVGELVDGEYLLSPHTSELEARERVITYRAL